jgi:hypothetical protein
LRTLPVSKDKRLEIFLQKKKEDEAFDAYQKARAALLTVIEGDPEVVNSQNPEEPKDARAMGTPRIGSIRRRGL